MTTDEILQILIATTACIGILFIIISRGRIKFGPFEIGGSDSQLDKQIDDIAAIVETNKEQDKNLFVKSLMEAMKNILPVVSIGGPTVNFDKMAELVIEALKKSPFGKKEQDPTWSLVEGLIDSYHKQALRQAGTQFWFSLIAASLGFISVFIVFFTGQSFTDKALGAIPGIAVDLVSALFFKQAEHTRERATALYDRLRKDNERTVAIDLINSIEDAELQSVIKAQLALKIGGVDSSIPELTAISRSKNVESKNGQSGE